MQHRCVGVVHQHSADDDHVPHQFSHQKGPEQDTTNAINHRQKCRKINDLMVYPVAHNGLVAGSIPTEPTNEISSLLSLVRDRRIKKAPLRYA
jgi:hypothetical protein